MSREEPGGDDEASASHSESRHVFHQHASGVSRALWPTNLRRSPATDRVAQRRRALVISRKWWVRVLAHAIETSAKTLIGVLSLFIGGCILAALLFHTWTLLLLPAAMLVILSLAITPSLLVQLKQTVRLPIAQRTRVLRSSLGIPTMQRSPETPVPTTPLVRELETFDLSQSEVEHFLDPDSTRDTTEHNTMELL